MVRANHSYFNLKGAGNGDVLNHRLQIFSDAVTPTDANHMATGEVMKVSGTGFDFTRPKPIGKDINGPDPAILATYNGTYATSVAPIELVISNQNGQLYMEPTGQPRIPLRSESDTEFSFEPSKLQLIFDGKGGLTFFQNGKKFSFEKK